MRAPLPLLEAFAADMQLAPDQSVASDTRARQWLAVASAAEALGVLKSELSGAAVNELISDLDAILPPASARPSIVHDVAAAPSPATTFTDSDYLADGSALESTVERIRVAAEEMEQHGFLNLAFTTVSALCRAMANNKAPARLMTTIHLGRIARQLSDINTATDCYRTVAVRGMRERDGPSAARGFIGLGMVALMKGNLPLVQKMFERAVLHAHPGSNTQGLGYMGLCNVARRQGKIADALINGWRSYDLLADGAEKAGMLGNISTIALEAGFPRAAMNGLLHVFSLNVLPSSSVAMFDDAMKAAAQLGEPDRVEYFEQKGLAAANQLQQPFEIARISLAAATSWQTLGNTDRCRKRALTTLELSRTHGYHELEARADAVLASLANTVHMEVRKNVPASEHATRTTHLNGDAVAPELQTELQRAPFVVLSTNVPFLNGIRRLEELSA